tara:strand:+ start:526 stop:963 length:438 start_codon:yes stop_codon:yes gene_type:complete
MRKFLEIILLGLLLTGCTNLKKPILFGEPILFEECHFSYDMMTLFDDHSFTIDKSKNTVVRTIIWNDKYIEKHNKKNQTKILKLNQQTFKIKSIKANHILTTPTTSLGVEYDFNLLNKTIQQKMYIGSYPNIVLDTLTCKRSKIF